VSVSTCGGLIHGGGLIFGGAYSRRFTVHDKLAVRTRQLQYEFSWLERYTEILSVGLIVAFFATAPG
jgi:hypothetical protein